MPAPRNSFDTDVGEFVNWCLWGIGIITVICLLVGGFVVLVTPDRGEEVTNEQAK